MTLIHHVFFGFPTRLDSSARNDVRQGNYASNLENIVMIYFPMQSSDANAVRNSMFLLLRLRSPIRGPGQVLPMGGGR